LSELAERRGVTVLAVTHFNKSGGSNSLERISGSIAFPAAARMVWGFSKDPNDPGRRLMLFGKSNVGPEVPGLAFRIIGTEDGRATIEWIVGAVSEKLEDVLRQEQEDHHKGDKLGQACDLIRELCARGPVASDIITARAKELGIGDYSIREAKKLLGCKSHRKGGFADKGVWMVSLNHNLSDRHNATTPRPVGETDDLETPQADPCGGSDRQKT
jgi:putative DNA primase/helicase